MFHILHFTFTSTLLSVVVLLLSILHVLRKKNRKLETLESSELVTGDSSLKEAPMPSGLPVLGHLHLLSGHEVPYQAFTELGKKYGSVVRLQLGSVKCVVVNDQKNIREALMTKGHHFDARPNFERYRQLFSGDKENSLAFCDWSDTQKSRRDMLRAFTFPRAFTHKYHSLERLIADANQEIFSLVDHGNDVEFKPFLLKQCANIFTNHFCSRTFQDDDKQFVQMVEDFDDIFWEVNQGYAADFLPFLMFLHRSNLKRINGLTERIRAFILERIVSDRYKKMNLEDDAADYVESLIKYVKAKEVPELPWDTALFALEDILGGHSAVGNFLMKLFAYVVQEEEVQRRIQEEIDGVAGPDARTVTIADRTSMPYTEATIFEAIRLIASPIVPRVANQHSSIDGFKVEKGTLLFLNNYDLSMSDQLWDQPEKFMPERFIRDKRIFKPDFFLPFGGGRRSCMGYKMVQLISFGILGGILQRYSIRPALGATPQQYKVPIGSLALPRHTFKFRFVRR